MCYRVLDIHQMKLSSKYFLSRKNSSYKELEGKQRENGEEQEGLCGNTQIKSYNASKYNNAIE